MTFEHRKLINELNRQAENRRIAEIERENAPLFWGMLAVFVVLALIGVWIA